MTDTIKTLLATRELLHTQDNRITANPIFCVQIKRRDVGFDTAFYDTRCWYNAEESEVIYADDRDFQKPPTGDQWEEYAYKDHWETVMVAFTQAGCEEYLRQNGHNDRARAHNGDVRIYVESFNRCPEMIAIREFLMAGLPGLLEQQYGQPSDAPSDIDHKTCKHEKFVAQVNVNRLEDSGRFCADVTVKCTQCNTPFRFLGLPCGLDLNGAAVSPCGTEARLAIGTPETVANIMDGDCPVGFTVRRGDQ